jgi:eukaryotic-like serine/threonine-protein kinase
MSLDVSSRIGPYEIVALIGTGGMGEVYHAKDSRLDRSVAIKVLTSARGVERHELDRFKREARAIARVNHPSICTVHDVGEHEGVPFLVMELLEGETLAERLELGALPVDRAVAIAAEIAEALDAAHSKEVVHRDLKPSNVMLTPNGVKLLDFGLAKLRDGDYREGAHEPTKSVPLTRDGELLGTLPYMAPEQIEGQETDTRTDIFSFGVMLFEMMTGRRPFAGNTRSALIAEIVGAQPLSASSLQPGISPALERVIERCLAKERKSRWQTARDLATELEWIAAGAHSQAVRSTFGRRQRWRLILIGLVAVIALTGLVVVAMMALAPPAAAVARYTRVTFRHGAVSSARFTPDGQSFVYSASWEGQPYNMFLGRPEGLDARDLSLQAGRILSISPSNDMAVLFGPQNVNRAFGARTLARVPLAGGARRDLLDGIVDADWIAGTNELAVVRDPGNGRPWRVEFPVGTVVHEARAAWSLRVSPDGTRVAFFEGPGLFTTEPEAMITVVDRSGRKSTLSKNWAGIGLAWSRLTDEIWFTATDGGRQAPWLQSISLAGVERTIQRAPDWLVLHDISADGRVLVSRNSIRINLACQLPGDVTEHDLSWGLAGTVRDLSADGRTLVFRELLGNDLRSTTAFTYRRPLDGSPAVRLGVGDPQSISPDAKWVLARLKDSLILLPTGSGSVVDLPKGNLVRVSAGAWLSDSKRVVITGDAGNNRPQGYIQDIPSGIPRPITSEGVVLAAKAAVRENTSVLGRSGGRWALYPIEGGPAQPVPAIASTDIPIRWSDKGQVIYIVDNTDGPGQPGRPTADVFRVDIVTGRRTHWKTLAPSDPVGVEIDRGSVVVAEDGRAYCYSFLRRLGDLFVVDGLK